MASKAATVYYGDHFDSSQQHDYDEVSAWLEDGTIQERDMPMPTRRHPERTKKVYVWMGVRMQKYRDTSAKMPGYVTHGNAIGTFKHVMIVRAWRPQLVVSPVMVPA